MLHECQCGGAPRFTINLKCPGKVAVQCSRCGMTTAYCDDEGQAWDQWEKGNVVPRDNVLSEIQGDPKLFDPDITASWEVRGHEVLGDG